MTAELKGIHAKTFQELDVIKDVLKLDEEKIAELEQKNETLSQNLDDAMSVENCLKKRIAELEKENAELDCQKNRNKFCYSCANATERCFRNEIGCPCDKYKSYKDENAELKSDNTEWERASNKWKSVYELTNNQLTKAKEIIKGLLSFVDSLGNYSGGIFAKAEQFLSEVEK